MRRTILILAAVALVTSGTLVGTTGAATGTRSPAASAATEHERKLTLKVTACWFEHACRLLGGRLRTVDGSSACTRRQPVRLQHWQHDGHEWVVVERGLTDRKGRFGWGVKGHGNHWWGLYRVLAPGTTLDTGDVCLRAISPERHT